MSYLVLARKWRPRRFAELVGQEHVVRALTNALETGRVHHAFLFTGTRGVGKTTIARIFAKSLNCERGTGAEPCGECPACVDIDAGRFVDLLEIDAASHTGVDNVRDLIDNAQYMPSRGRTKVYLIDEVHMLSKHAFNALLKTLEEPPGHVKFLLATTDPDKLPVTVLSRCLQFNLRRLEQAQIAGQIARILAAEGIASEPAAIDLLARAADGSLRDGLSLLDQAIAFTGGQLGEAAVTTMLGSVDRSQVGELLDALANGDGAALMSRVEDVASFSPDFAHVLEDLATALHQVQLRQLVPGFEPDAGRIDVAGLASRVPSDLVQLWYQMAVTGRCDLGLAPSPRTGFEMALLRMLAFRPAAPGAQAMRAPEVPTAVGPTPSRGFPAAHSGSSPPPARAGAASAASAASTTSGQPPASPTSARIQAGITPTPTPTPTPAQRETLAVPTHAPMETLAVPTHAPHETAPTPTRAPPEPAPMPAGNPSEPTALHGAEDWLAMVSRAGLKGPVRELAAHSAFCGHADGVLQLSLPDSFDHLRSDNLVRQLANALAAELGEAPRIRFESARAAASETLHSRTERQRGERQAGAEQAFLSDPVVARLMQQGGTVVPDSIRPLDDH